MKLSCPLCDAKVGTVRGSHRSIDDVFTDHLDDMHPDEMKRLRGMDMNDVLEALGSRFRL